MFGTETIYIMLKEGDPTILPVFLNVYISLVIWKNNKIILKINYKYINVSNFTLKLLLRLANYTVLPTFPKPVFFVKTLLLPQFFKIWHETLDSNSLNISTWNPALTFFKKNFKLNFFNFFFSVEWVFPKEDWNIVENGNQRMKKCQ